jgi:hypothetical protein
MDKRSQVAPRGAGRVAAPVALSHIGSHFEASADQHIITANAC